MERFASKLRALRERAGLTYAEMARVSHFSSTTLSQAAAGHRLPTRDVLLAYVSACGGDIHEWERRWEHLRAEIHASDRRIAVGAHLDAPDDPEATSFVGREDELESCAELLDTFRLVTLTGVGGVGKTRLAKRVAQNAAKRFTGGVYWVELADLSDEHAIADAIAASVGIPIASGQDPVSALSEVLRNRKVLLLLDNCEHLLTGCARTVKDLLARLPHVHVLATSRQPLDIGPEHVLPVKPLAVPRTHLAPDLQGSTSHERATPPAMVLFADRARSASPAFSLTEENWALVAHVCRKLDGLPLALEIAARRLRMVTLEELAERLDRRLPLLGRGGAERTAHARQQTLRALFDWSYELCTEAEREAWQQLALCSGGVLLTDAEHLCGQGPYDGNSQTAEVSDDVFEALAGLVDKSLLTRSTTGTRTRLHMLETVRAYGQERLTESGRAQQALLRHRAWYLGLAARAGTAYGTPDEAGWLRRLRAEHANLRLIVTAPPPSDEPPEMVLRASLGFWLHCLTSANVGEGARWMRTILERHPRPPSAESTVVWCQAVWVACFLLTLHGDYDGAHDLIERGEQAVAGTTSGTGAATPAVGRPDRDELSAAYLQMRGLLALVVGDMEAAVKYTRAALAVGRFSTALLTEPQCVAQLGFAAVLQGDRSRSTSLLEQALEMSEARGDSWHRCYLLWSLAVDHGEAERYETALRFLRRALRHMREIDEHLGEATLGETLAWLLSQRGDPRLATVLLGAVDQAWHPAGAPRLFGFARLTAHRERCDRHARAALGSDQYTRAYQEGQRLGIRQALELALGKGSIGSVSSTSSHE
ncbi:NB-ARC domain-containing protein [Streptomyces thermoalcalitolerans]|uniref:NB-ARC domain-containing protein n=1 Tax=Streptomyces thermoalcalitolerans TaxID=65605 RepID=A0ABN1ND30_9ACTN